MYGLFCPKLWLQKSFPLANWAKLPSQVVLFAHVHVPAGVAGPGAGVEPTGGEGVGFGVGAGHNAGGGFGDGFGIGFGVGFGVGLGEGVGFGEAAVTSTS